MFGIDCARSKFDVSLSVRSVLSTARLGVGMGFIGKR